MTTVPARVAGVREFVLCVPGGPNGRVAAPRRHWRRRRSSASTGHCDRWCPGDRRPGVRHRDDPTGRRRRRPRQRLRGAGQARGRRSRGDRVDRRARRRSSWSPTTPPLPARGSPSTWWPRPSTAPAGPAVLVTWDPANVADAVEAEAGRAESQRVSPRRAEIEATMAGPRAAPSSSTGRGRRLAVVERHRPRAPGADDRADPEALVGRRAPRRGGLLRPWARPRSATTSRASTTCCRPAAPPASPARCGSTTSDATSTSWSSTRRRWLTSRPHVAALAAAEGLDAHAGYGRAPPAPAPR